MNQCHRSHQIHVDSQNQQRNQKLDLNITSDNNPPGIASSVNTSQNRKDELNVGNAEETENEAFERIVPYSLTGPFSVLVHKNIAHRM